MIKLYVNVDGILEEVEVEEVRLRLSWRNFVKELNLTADRKHENLLKIGREVEARWAANQKPIFAGIIYEVNSYAGREEKVEALCRDYLAVFEKIILRTQYPPQTPGHRIVEEIVALASDYGVTGEGIQPAPELLSETRFENISALEALVQVARKTNYMLTVDPYKDVKFFPKAYGRSILIDPSLESTTLSGDPWESF